IEYSNQGHLLSISYDFTPQFRHHNDYNQFTDIRTNGKNGSIHLINLTLNNSMNNTDYSNNISYMNVHQRVNTKV
ncbi:unnamed protein product, partial [Rotaria sp. Silwood2]